jgi:hypothetical protein
MRGPARLPLASALACLVLLLPASAAGEGEVGIATKGEIGASQATRVADRDPKVAEERQEHPGLTSVANHVDDNWEVGYFAGGEKVALVIVDPRTGVVRESWTGYQVTWKMARGYSGAFGHKLNAPYVFLPLCALFLLGLLDWRRPWRIASLDLLVLLGFGVSHFFFNRAEVGVSVPIAYPVLIYLLARGLWIGIRSRGEGLRPVWPTTWLLVAALFLLGLRVGLNLADSGAIDVGYASVVGADRITHGKAPYEDFPEDVSQGDTYGPVVYYSYVPFEAVWPWSGSWDDLQAAHGAAVFFDLATFALLLLLGRRIRPGPAGSRLAATLAFGWAAYPYTAYALESNSNDTLVALLLVATLVLIARPLARGALAALATFTKFAPALLAPMLATYVARGRGVARFALAFAAVAGLAMLWPAVDPGLGTFWDRTIGFQADRDSPFSIWGQAPGLEPLRIALIAALGALSIALAFWPTRKSLTQLSALAAALLIGAEILAHHWFYLYIVWFYPLLLVALATLEEGEGAPPELADTRQGGRGPIPLTIARD